MLPNRIVLKEGFLVYHTRTTTPLWRPYYDIYRLTVTDSVLLCSVCSTMVRLISETDLFVRISHQRTRLSQPFVWPVTPFDVTQIGVASMPGVQVVTIIIQPVHVGCRGCGPWTDYKVLPGVTGHRWLVLTQYKPNYTDTVQARLHWHSLS